MTDTPRLSRRARLVLGGLALVLAAGIGARLAFGRGPADADEGAPTASEARLESGALVLAPEQVQALDLRTAPAQPTAAREARPVHGVVLDPLPFLDLDSRRRSASAALRAAQAAEAAAQAELARVSTLHAEDRGASDRSLQEARRTAAEAGAARATAEGEARRAQAAWAQQGLPSVDGLATFHRVLVRLDLPLGLTAPSPLPPALSATAPAVAGTFTLRVLGLAPGGSPLTGGLALLAEASTRGLRPGVPVDAVLQGPAKARVRIPRTALVWAGDQAAVFLQSAPGRFQRRPVTVAFTGGPDLVLEQGLAPGDPVVVQGALELQGEYARLAEGAAIGAGGR